MAMCSRLDASSIAVHWGDRPGTPAFSVARLDEGPVHLGLRSVMPTM